LYALLGVKGVGSKASEKEIRGAYKRAALEWHNLGADVGSYLR